MLDWSHLWAERFPIPPHALMAIVALPIGAAQLVLPKGSLLHRVVGYIWVILMAGTAISAMFIHEIRMWGLFSPIHLLIPVTLVSLILAIRAARLGNIKRHQTIMVLLFISALVVTGLFTLMPGRAMHAVLFGIP